MLFNMLITIFFSPKPILFLFILIKKLNNLPVCFMLKIIKNEFAPSLICPNITTTYLL